MYRRISQSFCDDLSQKRKLTDFGLRAPYKGNQKHKVEGMIYLLLCVERMNVTGMPSSSSSSCSPSYGWKMAARNQQLLQCCCCCSWASRVPPLRHSTCSPTLLLNFASAMGSVAVDRSAAQRRCNGVWTMWGGRAGFLRMAR